MPRSDHARFASIYDTIYADPGFLAIQEAFLAEHLGPPGRILDAGCGTGQHLVVLDRLGWQPVGLDLNPAMLEAAKENCSGAGLAPALVLGDIRTLPFAGVFDAAVCLESPLAYLLGTDDLVSALVGLRRALRPGGRFMADVFDYPATAGKARVRAATRRFEAEWGHVDVTESHRHDRKARLWYMFQRFEVDRKGKVERFEVSHRLATRAAPEYAEAIERAGFSIEVLLPAYPGLPPALRHERRILVVARRRD